MTLLIAMSEAVRVLPMIAAIIVLSGMLAVFGMIFATHRKTAHQKRQALRDSEMDSGIAFTAAENIQRADQVTAQEYQDLILGKVQDPENPGS